MFQTIVPLTEILSSKAKTQVLRTLAFAEERVSLRELMFRGNLGSRSVQNALEELEREGVVRRTKRGHRVFFKLSGPYCTSFILKDLFLASSDLRIEARAKLYAKRCKAVLRETDALNAMISHAKASR